MFGKRSQAQVLTNCGINFYVLGNESYKIEWIDGLLRNCNFINESCLKRRKEPTLKFSDLKFLFVV